MRKWKLREVKELPQCHKAKGPITQQIQVFRYKSLPSGHAYYFCWPPRRAHSGLSHPRLAYLSAYHSGLASLSPDGRIPSSLTLFPSSFSFLPSLLPPKEKVHLQCHVTTFWCHDLSTLAKKCWITDSSSRLESKAKLFILSDLVQGLGKSRLIHYLQKAFSNYPKGNHSFLCLLTVCSRAS